MPEEYPLHLIPNKTLAKISENDLDNSHYIGIWVEGNEQLKESDGKLNGGVIKLSRLPNFSNNKIPNSVIRDLNIKFKSEVSNAYQADWEEGMDGLNPTPDDFYFDDHRQHYFLKISNINGYTDSYEKSGETFPFKLKLKHKPTLTNFWHFEFRIFANGEEIEYKKSAWLNNICASIRGNIIKSAKFEITPV